MRNTCVSRIDDRERYGIQNGAVDNCSVVDGVPLDIERERGSLAQRSAHIAAVLLQQERRLLSGVRIPRIPEVVAEVVEGRPTEPVAAGLGEDLDAAGAERVVLGREGVGVDPNFADRLFRRKLAAAEAIDEDLAAIRTRRWSGQRLQVGRKIIRVVGERLQIVPPKHQGPGIFDGSVLTAGPAFSATVTCSDLAATWS